MIVTLGWSPIPLKVVLVMGQDWIVTLKPKAGAVSPVWPVGTTITAKFYPSGQDTSLPIASWDELDSWPATITGDDVTWEVEAVDSDGIPDGALVRVTVNYPDTPAGDDYVWLSGRVTRSDRPAS